MDATEFIAMYDFCWFEMEIFRPTRWSASLNHQQQPPAAPPPPPPEGSNPRHNQSTTASSTSGYSYSKPNFNSGVFLDSPDSVLTPPQQRNPGEIEERKSVRSLEFEELQGFMDLGLVFTEEDKKDQRLVSILPGLERLWKTESSVRRRPPPERPYLSEAWAVKEEQEKKKISSPSTNWKVPMRDDVEMKVRLRLWAHSVASTLR